MPLPFLSVCIVSGIPGVLCCLSGAEITRVLLQYLNESMYLSLQPTKLQFPLVRKLIFTPDLISHELSDFYQEIAAYILRQEKFPT